MSVLDRDLVRAVNSGRAFMLVGTGPSNAAGLPSWDSLAHAAVGIALAAGVEVSDATELLAKKDYPEVFARCSDAVGLAPLCEQLAPLLKSDALGPVYPILARWPIQTYLTTNFDDHLVNALHAGGQAFVSKCNSRTEMQQLRADTRSTVFKLHGELGRPQDVVLTTSQYADFTKNPDRRYWRDIVFSVLRNVDVLIVGYSVSDPNFQEQLEWARECSAPNRPAFMFATGLTNEEIDDLYTKYNIRVLEYDNASGDHHELVRVLRRYDPFIAGRDSGLLGLEEIDDEQASLAGALHVFTKTRVEDGQDTCLQSSYCALILAILADNHAEEDIPLDQLLVAVRTKVGGTVDPPVAQRAIDHLYQSGFVAWNSDLGSVRLLPGGAERIAISMAERSTIEQQFQAACEIYLRTLPGGLDSEACERIVAAMKHGIVAAFDRRGMEIAKAAMTDAQVDISDATDVLTVINERGSSLETLEERAAFADLTIHVLLEPTPEIKSYLASVSQGYFAYHALGWDSRVTDERLAMAREHTWVLDSSILLFLLAQDSQNHRYASELLARMSELGLPFLTSERLMDEVEGHARWAISDFSSQGVDSLTLLENVMVSPGHRQNVFAQGFARWSGGKGAPTFAQYLETCIGTSSVADLRECLLTATAELGIEVRRFEDWPTIATATDAYFERDELAKTIRAERERRGTFRSEEQCLAEAEVILLARQESAAFLTPSSVLSGIAGASHRVNWRPEAMYRFLSLFTTGSQSAETLYESMIQTFYYSGFNVVDRTAISAYTAGLVHQARMQMEDARKEYSKALEEKDIGGIVDDFESVPDEQKPFYAIQFAHYVAVRAARKTEQAERAADAARRHAKLNDKDRDELRRLQSAEMERKRKAQKRARRDRSTPKRKRRHK